MPKISAGLLMYRKQNSVVEFFITHPGGPFFKNKDEGWWSIPKGLVEEGEEFLDAAKREFEEETGIKPEPPFINLGFVVQKGGKKIYAWAFEGKCDNPSSITCNTFTMEWPPKSGKFQSFSEIDSASWMDLQTASLKMNQEQSLFLHKFMEALNK